MIVLAAVAMIDLITVHMVDGRVVQINPQTITQLLHGKEVGNKALVEGVNCAIRLVDGSFVSVKETCQEVQAELTASGAIPRH